MIIMYVCGAILSTKLISHLSKTGKNELFYSNYFPGFTEGYFKPLTFHVIDVNAVKYYCYIGNCHLMSWSKIVEVKRSNFQKVQ